MLSTITEEQLRKHIEILASDAFEGRKPGTAGENRTVNYIATEWRKAGLSGGAANSRWYMEVGLVERSPTSQKVTFFRQSANRTRKVDIGDGQIVLRGAEAVSQLSDIPLIHAGYAAASVAQLRPEVEGKIVFLFRFGRPNDPGFPSYRERKARLIAAGARGVIAVIRGENRWLRFGRRFQRTVTSLDRHGQHAEVEGMISEAGLARLLRLIGLNAKEVYQGRQRKNFRRPTLARKCRTVCRNAGTALHISQCHRQDCRSAPGWGCASLHGALGPFGDLS